MKKIFILFILLAIIIAANIILNWAKERCECGPCEITYRNPMDDRGPDNEIIVQCCFRAWRDDEGDCNMEYQRAELKNMTYAVAIVLRP
jgi:hypothetical protein